MIIAHIAEYASGGVATYLKNLILEQEKNINISQIYLICSNKNSDFSVLTFKSPKIKVIKYNYTRGLSGFIDLLKIRKIINFRNVDIIHLHSTFAGVLRLPLTIDGYRKKILYCSHGWAFNKETSTVNKALYKIIEKILSFMCYKIINISDNEEKSASFINNKKMITIKNSIPDIGNRIEIKDLKNSKSKELLFIGRLDRQKGVDLLINEVTSLNEKASEPIFNLKVVGDQILKDGVVKKKNLNGVKFLGWQSANEIEKLLQESDALIIPSRWEGFGLTALEAMRSSRMVIASDAGALPEIISNDVTGIIFEKKSPQSLQSALAKFNALSQTKVIEYGQQGRQRYLSEFSYSDFMDKMNKLYKEVITIG